MTCKRKKAPEFDPPRAFFAYKKMMTLFYFI